MRTTTTNQQLVITRQQATSCLGRRRLAKIRKHENKNLLRGSDLYQTVSRSVTISDAYSNATWRKESKIDRLTLAFCRAIRRSITQEDIHQNEVLLEQNENSLRRQSITQEDIDQNEVRRKQNEGSLRRQSFTQEDIDQNEVRLEQNENLLNIQVDRVSLRIAQNLRILKHRGFTSRPFSQYFIKIGRHALIISSQFAKKDEFGQAVQSKFYLLVQKYLHPDRQIDDSSIRQFQTLPPANRISGYTPSGRTFVDEESIFR